MTHYRKVSQIIEPRFVIEGAGVRLEEIHFPARQQPA